MQSLNQISTANCKLSCETQKLCPEILAINCDDYWQKSCDCTLYCKKTLKFLSQFVSDQSQLAEIEDLCLIGEALQNTNNTSMHLSSAINVGGSEEEDEEMNI
jgi:hypothetical protein